MHNPALQDAGLDFGRLLSAFKRRRKLLILSFIAALALVLAVVLLWPASYKSQSTILIEQQEIPEDLVRSTVTSYADQRIEIIAQRVMTSSNLWQIIEKYKLYQDERKRETREYIIHQMREDAISRRLISAEVIDPRSGRPTEATIAFQLAFSDESPLTAQRVANELTSLFLSENLKTRTQMAEQASAFLASEATKLNATVSELEQQLATFKKENFGSLPGLTDLNLRLLDRTEQAVRENTLAQGSLKERIIYLQSELAQIDPHKSLISGNGQAVLSSTARLKLAKQQLEQARAKYSAAHPTVQKLEGEVGKLADDLSDSEAPALKLEIYRAQLAQLQARYSDQHPSVKSLVAKIDRLEALPKQSDKAASEGADNPAYLQIKAQLEAAQLELLSLKKQGQLLVQDLSKYEQRITDAPGIEQTFQQLTRDYQSAVLKYAEVKAKQQEANLGRALESEQKAERFTLIEPPLVPEEPSSPNRKLLAVLGLVLALGVSVGLVLLRELSDKSIRGRKALLIAVGAPPLAVIPSIATTADNQGARKLRWVLALGLALALAVALALFHVFVKPLDVTWFIAMRKFGLM